MVQLRIQKREGQIVNFDKTKIYNAVLKAMQNGSGIVKKNIAQAIADEIEEELTEAGRDIVKISEIETLVLKVYSVETIRIHWRRTQIRISI